MSDTNDIRADLEMYGQMWDELEGMDPTVGEPQVPAPAEQPESEFGGLVSSRAQDFYYSYLGDEESNAGSEPADSYDTELMQEEKSQNPVYPDSVGADHEGPSAVWVDEDLLKEVEGLKNKLFEVENRLAKQMGGGDKWVEKAHHPNDKKLMTQIESIRKSIEKVSNKLGVENEPSPWEIKKD